METKNAKSNKVTCTVVAGGKNESFSPTVSLNNKSQQSNEKLVPMPHPSKQVRSMTMSTNAETNTPQSIESISPYDDKLVTGSTTESDSIPEDSMPNSTSLMPSNSEHKYAVLLDRFDEIISLLDRHNGHIPHQSNISTYKTYQIHHKKSLPYKIPGLDSET